MPKRADNPYCLGYSPEIDAPRVLEPTEAFYYQSLIGVIRWMMEIGHVDINIKVSLLSSDIVLP